MGYLDCFHGGGWWGVRRGWGGTEGMDGCLGETARSLEQVDMRNNMCSSSMKGNKAHLLEDFSN